MQEQYGTYGGGPTQPPKKRHSWLKVVAIVIAVIIVGNIAVAFFAAMLFASAVTVGISSCSAAISDPPIQESQQVTAFIEDQAVTDRDLLTFDALSGCFQSLYEHRLRYDVTSDLSPDALRAQLATGAWPSDGGGYGEVSSTTSPQLWVRLAELAQDYLQDKTGDRWEVVDFSYPFPDNGPIPVPPKRTEISRVTTLLLCRSGDDTGLFCTVDYYRWASPTRFEDHLEDAREERQEQTQLLAQIESLETLSGYQVLLDGSELLVWDQGEEDALRDPETFVSLVNQVQGLANGYARVTLLASDTPTRISYRSVSYDYPNERDVQQMSPEACRVVLLNASSWLDMDYAKGDVLLYGSSSADRSCTTDDLSGSLAPVPKDDYSSKWYQPSEGAYTDSALCSLVSSELGLEEESVIAISLIEESGFGDLTQRSWVVVPAGSLPEDPEGFCATANNLLDKSWSLVPDQSDPEKRKAYYLRVYEIDEETITREGEKQSFEDLKAAATTSVAAIEDYHFEVLLHGYPHMTQWSVDEEPDVHPVVPSDVGGSIAHSREWRYGAEQ